ncbi:TGS domain-containing protein [Acidobacteria bacterium AH-259-D05]|nr:TGS domain-containing protein [Acidobacteria bacterium AH-259-D05]
MGEKKLYSYNKIVPANLTPEYLQAEEKFKNASSKPEKIAALQEMLRTIPKHKGTEKMQADIKRRLSRLRKESQKKKSTASQKPFYYVEREGAGQVVLCGPPNGGKSQLLDNLTHAAPEVAEYPYTTRTPLPGMMTYQDIKIQLVDTPPLAPEILEPWQLAMIEQADVALLLFDVNDPNLLEQTEYVLTVLEDRRISINDRQRPTVIVLGNKTDDPHGKSNFAAWQELYREQFRAEPFSALSDDHLSQIRQRLFDVLQIVRVYTKAPGKTREENPTPYVLRRGSTIVDVATTVHKDVAKNFKFARVWGKTKFEGQMVERNYVVEDGDLVELHG